MGNTLIIGSRGSMGRRYQSILEYISKPFICADIGDNSIQLAADSERIILCTPTDTHYELLKQLIPLKKPILCEKPIVKDLVQLQEIFTLCNYHGTPFHMVAQYTELVNRHYNHATVSYYDYFRTGNDGLAWDCMQIIGLSRHEVKLHNKSPIWSCSINGKTLQLSHMDAAYVNYVRKWYSGHLQLSQQDYFKMHEKVVQWINSKS